MKIVSEVRIICIIHNRPILAANFLFLRLIIPEMLYEKVSSSNFVYEAVALGHS